MRCSSATSVLSNDFSELRLLISKCMTMPGSTVILLNATAGKLNLAMLTPF
jgi:hypothetical protein